MFIYDMYAKETLIHEEIYNYIKNIQIFTNI